MSIIPAAILEPEGCQEREIMRPVIQRKSNQTAFKNKCPFVNSKNKRCNSNTKVMG